MSQEQNTQIQIQKVLNYISSIAQKQNLQEQQQTLILLLNAISSHVRIMTTNTKLTAKKTTKSQISKPAPMPPPSASAPKPQNPQPQKPQVNTQQDLIAKRAALAPISPNSTIP